MTMRSVYHAQRLVLVMSRGRVRLVGQERRMALRAIGASVMLSGARPTTWVPSPMSLACSDRGLWRVFARGVPAGVGGAPAQACGHE